MKRINKNIIQGVYLATILLVVGFLASCKKEALQQPVITGVKVTNPLITDSLTRALPGTYIIIKGRNLDNATSITFNGYPAYFNPTYVTGDNIVIQIPAETPTPDRFPDVPNTIAVTTPAGTATYSFTVVPPSPAVTEVDNENPMPGATVTIRGRYLWGIKTVVFPGSIPVTNFTVNDSGSVLKVIAPEGMGSDADTLRLESPFGIAKYIVPLNKFKGSGIISNFDDIYNVSGSSVTVSSDAASFPLNNGKFLRFTFAAGPWNSQWWVGNRGITISKALQALTAVAGPEANLADYALKFEVNTKVPWNGALIRFVFSDNKDIEKIRFFYRPYLDFTNRIFNTGNTWVTATIPLSRFEIYQPPFTSPYKYAAVKSMSDFAFDNNSTWNLYVRSYSESIAVNEFDAAFDNIRIVKIK